jgi:hypothetical protein
MSISSEALKSVWVDDLRDALVAAESAERDLSYLSASRTENERKQTGSYYTPADVAEFFWRQYFQAKRISTPEEFGAFIKATRFIEPSAGAGALVFSMLAAFAKGGASKSQISKINIIIVDVNAEAISFVRKLFDRLSERLGVSFKGVELICEDFRSLDVRRSNRKTVIFGNPPFFKNQKGSSPWKNVFADFTERSLRVAGADGDVQLILPLSVAFSRDYAALRTMLRAGAREIVLSSFDNMPDMLFKSGKPHSTNTNKANSQRCSILTALHSDRRAVSSTRLLRWSKEERSTLLGRLPAYVDVSDYEFDDQLPRPHSSDIMRYLDKAQGASTFGDLIRPEGKEVFYATSVARNFIGIREEPVGAAHRLAFKSKQDFYRGLLILTSDVFMAYWLTVGDGFHVTKADIHDFPLSPALLEQATESVAAAKKIWSARRAFAKSKLNAGRPTESFDFSSSMPALIKGFSLRGG